MLIKRASIKKCSGKRWWLRHIEILRETHPSRWPSNRCQSEEPFGVCSPNGYWKSKKAQRKIYATRPAKKIEGSSREICRDNWCSSFDVFQGETAVSGRRN